MYETTYHLASDVKDAAARFAAAGEGRYLAGGQTLIPTMKQRLAAPSDLIDISHLAELKGIAASGELVTIGAATTHAEVQRSDAVSRAIPALAALAGQIGDPAVRHRGTLGGSLANNDPAADYPAAALALGATIHTDKRAIPADEFFTGLFATALDDGEIITKVAFPVPAGRLRKVQAPGVRLRHDRRVRCPHQARRSAGGGDRRRQPWRLSFRRHREAARRPLLPGSDRCRHHRRRRLALRHP